MSTAQAEEPASPPTSRDRAMAYTAGAVAAAGSKGVDDNPYPAGSEQSYSWTLGFMAATPRR